METFNIFWHYRFGIIRDGCKSFKGVNLLFSHIAMRLQTSIIKLCLFEWTERIQVKLSLKLVFNYHIYTSRFDQHGVASLELLKIQLEIKENFSILSVIHYLIYKLRHRQVFDNYVNFSIAFNNFYLQTPLLINLQKVFK